MYTRVTTSKRSLDGESSSLPQGTSSEAATEPESGNGSQPIEIDDEEDWQDVGSKRKLTSEVWKEFKRVKLLDEVKAQCMHCGKKLSAKSKSGTKHLHVHLTGCPYRRSKLASKDKVLAQTSLRFSSKQPGSLSLENYSFDPDVARRELADVVLRLITDIEEILEALMCPQDWMRHKYLGIIALHNSYLFLLFQKIC
jgi:hypothetical protein